MNCPVGLPWALLRSELLGIHWTILWFQVFVFSIWLSCLWSLLVMPRSALLVSWMVLLEPPMVATFEGLTHSGKVDKHVKANCLNQLMWSDLKEVFYLRLGWHLIPLVFSVNLCCSNQSRNLYLYGSTVRLWWVKSSYVSYMRALGKINRAVLADDKTWQ